MWDPTTRGKTSRLLLILISFRSNSIPKGTNRQWRHIKSLRFPNSLKRSSHTRSPKRRSLKKTPRSGTRRLASGKMALSPRTPPRCAFVPCPPKSSMASIRAKSWRRKRNQSTMANLTTIRWTLVTTAAQHLACQSHPASTRTLSFHRSIKGSTSRSEWRSKSKWTTLLSWYTTSRHGSWK